jgi:single-stranded DNA-binding protein
MFQNQGVNKIILVGHVMGQPEWRTVAQCRSLYLQLLTIENINRQGAVQQHFENHFLRFPESVADFAVDDLQDGTPLYVEGKISTTQSIDAKGIKRYDTSIIVNKYSIVATMPEQVSRV